MLRDAKPVITSSLLTDFWDTLRAQLTAAVRPERGREVFETAVRDGWVGVIEVEGYLLDACAMPVMGKVRDMLAAFGMAPTTTFRRPSAKDREAYGIDRLRVAEFADFLIQLERLGFAVDPAPLCQALRPALMKRPHLDGSELAVFWHARERHRMAQLVLRTGAESVGETADTLRTRSGYVAELRRNAGGAAHVLAVTPPRYRHRSGMGADVFA